MSRNSEFHESTGLTPVPLDTDGAGPGVVRSTGSTGKSKRWVNPDTVDKDVDEVSVTDVRVKRDEQGNAVLDEAGRPVQERTQRVAKVAPKAEGTKSQPLPATVKSPKPTKASKSRDNKSPLVAPVIGAGGAVEGTTVAEREEIHPDERRDAERRAGNATGTTSGPRTGSGRELDWGQLAKVDPSIHRAFKEHRRNWRRRERLGMGMQQGVARAAASAERERMRKDNAEPVEHPAFRSDTTYHQIAAALSDSVGLVNDHKNLDENGKPTVRSLNADDLRDFARFHRNIFGQSHTVDEEHEGVKTSYRVDPAAFSMFHLVGKHQRREQGASVPKIKVAGHSEPQDAYHWMVDAIKTHVDTNASKVRRDTIKDTRAERFEAAKAQTAADNVPAPKTGNEPAPAKPASDAYGRSTRTVSVGIPPIKQKDGMRVGGLDVGSSFHHPHHGEGRVVGHVGHLTEVDFGELHPVDRTPVLRKLPRHTEVGPVQPKPE